MAKDRVICGVDVGSSKIATLIATIGEDNRINLIGVSATNSRGVKKSQIEQFSSLIEECNIKIEVDIWVDNLWINR